MLQTNLFPFSTNTIQSPRELIQAQHPVIYEIKVFPEHNDASLTISIWDKMQELSTYTLKVKNFNRHIMMAGSYLRAVTDTHYHTKNNALKQAKEFAFLRNAIVEIGDEIWQYIHLDNPAKAMWDQFIQLVHGSNKTGLILAVGKEVATWPIECMVESKTGKSGSHFVVAKNISLRPNNLISWPEQLQIELPKTLVLLIGPDEGPMVETLTAKEEVKEIYTRFYPNDGDEFYRFFIQMGYRHPEAAPSEFNFYILDQQTSIEQLEEQLKEIKESYIFIFSGHGVHEYSSTLDGKLYWPQKRNYQQELVSHKELQEVFRGNPPFAVIFNCCSTLRTANVQELPIVEFQPMEQLYHSIPYPNRYRILFANRAAKLDKTSFQITQNIANHMVSGGNSFDLLEALSPRSRQYPEEGRTSDLQKRDRVVGTTMIL